MSCSKLLGGLHYMFSRFAKWADAIEDDCLRILVYMFTLFISVGVFFGLFESEFKFWIWLLIWPGIFSIIGIGVVLAVCIIIKLASLFSSDDNAIQESEQQTSPEDDTSTENLPQEKRRCKECGSTEMVAIKRDEFIINSFEFECPDCGHKVNLNESGAVGVYTVLSLILFVFWLVFFLDAHLYTLHYYFSYIVTFMLIWYLPVSMAIKRWRYPITDTGTTAIKSSLSKNNNDIANKAIVMSNAWLSTASFLHTVLTLIGFIALFLGGAMILGIIHDYGIESIWNGQLVAILWEGIQLLIDMII